MSNAIAAGRSLIAAYLGGSVSEIPSSAVVMKQEPGVGVGVGGGGGGGGQASFLTSSSTQQSPQIFHVDLNANDYAFSLDKALSNPSKVETARPGPDSSVEEEIGKIKEQHESQSSTLPPPLPPPSSSLRFLSEVNPGFEEHPEISPVAWMNPVNFGEGELKVRRDAEDVKRNSNANRYMNLRKKSRRLSEDRPRQKRQAARDMCRPLKQWLYSHRDTPYPSKTEKQDLAARSRMTLTQVSNWFANARRRLKNTVSGGPDVTWARRIKLYNRYVVGNQELLSVSSDDTMWDDDNDDITMDADGTTIRNEEEEEEEEGREGQCCRESETFTRRKDRSSYGSTRIPSGRYLDADPDEDPTGRTTVGPPTFDGPGATPPPPGKFKQGILQRYLTDACERVVQIKAKKRKNTAINDEDDDDDEEEESEEEEEEEEEEGRRQKSRRSHHRNRFRNASGSLSSHDYEEEMSLSAPGTPTKEHHSISNEIQDDAKDIEHRNSSSRDRDDLYWKEISAAMALTSLAMRSRLNSGSSRASSARI